MPGLNLYNVTNHEPPKIVITPEIAAHVRLGAGLNLNDPTRPRPGNSPFDDPTPNPDAYTAAVLNPLEDFNSVIDKEVTVEEDSRSLHVYLAGNYGLADASASYDYAYHRKDTHKVMYAWLWKFTSGPVVDLPPLKWKHKPTSEDVQDKEVLEQFVEDHGSHYVSSIVYGWRLVVRGELNSTDVSERTAFSGAFSAQFSGGGIKGGISAEQKKTLASEKVNIQTRLLSGGVKPENATVFQDYDEIAAFLKGLKPEFDAKGNKIKDTIYTVYSGPLEILTQSYWHTLPLEFNKSRNALLEVKGIMISADNGVPNGTVIAWSPRRDQQFVDGEGKRRLGDLPRGWAICDGSAPDVPDLREKFIQGTASLEQVNVHNENSMHDHKAKATWAGPAGGGFNAVNGRSGGVEVYPQHVYNITVEKSQNIPPYWKLIYLIKL